MGNPMLYKIKADWKAKAKKMSPEEVDDYLKSFVGKAMKLKAFKDRRVEVDRLTNQTFAVTNVITGTDYTMAAWHIVSGEEIKKQDFIDKYHIKKSDIDDFYQIAYSLIYENWPKYLKSKQPSNRDVEIARLRITDDLCPWYSGSVPCKIWQEALVDLPRKLHPTYIPVTKTEKKELWK
jgi:hypothetical protein